MTKIKICGIRSFKDIEYVNEAKPDYIGFVFAKSKRRVDFNLAYLLKNELNKEIKAVGVFVNEDIDFIKKLCERNVIDIVQLHGDEDEDYINDLKKKVYNPVIKAYRIKNSTGKTLNNTDYALFDAYSKTNMGEPEQALTGILSKTVTNRSLWRADLISAM